MTWYGRGQRVEIVVLGEWLPGTVEQGSGHSRTGSVLVELDDPVVIDGATRPVARFYRGEESVRHLVERRTRAFSFDSSEIPRPFVRCDWIDGIEWFLAIGFGVDGHDAIASVDFVFRATTGARGRLVDRLVRLLNPRRR